MRPRLRRWLLGLSLGTLALTALTCGAWSMVRASAGEPTAALADTWHEGHRILDRRGRLLRELTSDLGLRGQPRALEDMGPRLLAATLVSEDKAFFEHDGLDPHAIVRAALQTVRHGRLVSGASTITQQLVKMLDARGQTRARGLGDKLLEVARAQNLEEQVSKEEILLAYLNRLPYGHGLTGPEVAARGYFGVAPRDLSWAQAAFLAVLPRAPSYLDPYVRPERVLLRQRALLGALRDAGELSDLEHDRAVAEPIELRPLTRPFFAPHLVDALKLEGRLSPGTATTTTLDLDLQRDIEGAVRVHLAAIEDRGASDAAVLVVDNDTGDVLAYVGSADFHSDEISGQVDMVRARRQPGSTLKPFVYGLAFAAGHFGPELTADVPTTFQERGGGSYTPENFDRGFEGPIPLREALAGSLNIPAVRLAAELGPAALLTTLRTLGLRSLDRDADHYGLALALGSGEVELRELAGAYVALARGGEAIALRYTTTDPASAPVQVFAPDVAALVTEALSDPLARVRGLHGRGPFQLAYPVAVKTGTSSGYRDTWTVGYTRERTVAVWLGNADSSPTARLTGASGAGPLFADVMRRAMADVPQRRPLWQPELLVDLEVCPLSGAPVGPACDEAVHRKFSKDHVPKDTCNLHVHVRPDRSAPAGLRCDPQAAATAVVFPPEYDEWLAYKTAGGDTPDMHGRPWLARARVPGCDDRPAALPVLRVVAPAPGTVFALDQRRDAQTIEVRAELDGSGVDLGELAFLVDGREVGRSAWPYKLKIAAEPGDHEVLARPADPRLSARLESTRFSVR
ncbi:penicillin-binding protein 1C [Nannocystis sp. SCPEA4]|uniref:penicillin-binding protein 1C n=1 Tax=Nannocystis sp. SCPEA4 TaxID=2996787 RepID=UPI00226E4835|nr:penicillin-binding protein 1C [Nannocystis sp. SCPEA4]MCY1056963.1 penicillin-binding protein 1C [Nannocystis sp. SCPEA4]